MTTSAVYGTADRGRDPMNAPVLASAADVIVASGGITTDPADPRIRYALRAASSRFRLEVKHPVHRVTDDTIVVDGEGTNIVRLPRVNVDARAVRVDGREIPPEDWTVTRTGILRFRRAVVAVDARVEVDADHGFEYVPEEIQQAIVDLAARIVAIPIGAKQASLGTAQMSYGSDVGSTQQWADAVEAYRIGGRA